MPDAMPVTPMNWLYWFLGCYLVFFVTIIIPVACYISRYPASKKLKTLMALHLSHISLQVLFKIWIDNKRRFSNNQRWILLFFFGCGSIVIQVPVMIVILILAAGRRELNENRNENSTLDPQKDSDDKIEKKTSSKLDNLSEKETPSPSVIV